MSIIKNIEIPFDEDFTPSPIQVEEICENCPFYVWFDDYGYALCVFPIDDNQNDKDCFLDDQFLSEAIEYLDDHGKEMAIEYGVMPGRCPIYKYFK